MGQSKWSVGAELLDSERRYWSVASGKILVIEDGLINGWLLVSGSGVIG